MQKQNGEKLIQAARVDPIEDMIMDWKRTHLMKCLRISILCLLAAGLLSASLRVQNNMRSHLYIPGTSLIVISIGSTSRQDLLQVQAAKLGKYVTIHPFSEVNVPKCFVCNHTHEGETHPDGLIGRSHESHSWWCAQKRPLLAAYEVLKHAKQLPDFLLVIDDDTFVNPVALSKFVMDSQELVGKPAYVGHLGSPRMVMGGGGTVITRAVLDAWKHGGDARPWAPLKWCIEQTQGGNWCHWHSDWAYGLCVHKWSGANATDMQHIFNQNREPCTPQHVACHNRVDVKDWIDTWDRNVG